MGLGEEGEHNPLSVADTPVLEGLLGGEKLSSAGAATRGESRGVVARSLDATLGYPGLPQSATGQSVLLTGRDACAVMGGHYGPWPGPTLKGFLEEGNLFSKLRDRGRRAFLANAYPPDYFEALRARRMRANVPVHAALSAGLKLPMVEDFEQGRAVPADLGGEHFVTLGLVGEPLEPRMAGATLARIAAQHHFTFFDFWLSDRLGHRGSMPQAVSLVERLDAFLGGVVEELGETTLLITSDHGNLEDKSSRRHTRAPVPLIAVGPGRQSFTACHSLLDVAPAIEQILLGSGSR